MAEDDSAATGGTARPVSTATTKTTSITTGTFPPAVASEVSGWRIRERIRTVAAGLILCLHLGVDPPDVLKTAPTARLECWTDPETVTTTGDGVESGGAGNYRGAGEIIMRNLQQQYEFWQPKARYKALLDPTSEELRRLCVNLRKSAKEERILLHYNGHGVPRPTRAGELWAFNKQYTQYIPVSAAEVANWIGTPVLVVVDSSAAANVGAVWQRLAEQSGDAEGADVLMLAACGAEELLPMAPEMPADLFTACLTTPMEIAIRWHLYRGGPLLPSLTLEAAMSIPGRLNDRRTPLGELNWILTAITDTIGWTVLPRPLFQRLFRQDVLVASLFRNYLLAVRVMRAFRCTPQSWPPIPTAAVASHELWQAWDQALDAILVSLQGTGAGIDVPSGEPSTSMPVANVIALPQGGPTFADTSREASSPFFLGQMDAFELWIQQRTLLGARAPPVTSLHLPSVLQVLLSQTHRSRALTLLGQFCDLGPWAVRDALHVGVFPYLLKLFQSPAGDIRYALLYIWLRILRFDPSVVGDLSREDAWRYFVRILAAAGDPAEVSIEAFEMRTMAAIGLCLVLLDQGFRGEREVRDPETNVDAGTGTGVANTTASSGVLKEILMTEGELIGALLEAAGGATPPLSEWALHLLSVLPWKPSSVSALQQMIFPLLEHERCANRAAAIHLLGTLLERINDGDGEDEEQAQMLETTIVYRLLGCLDECYPRGRRELVIALSRLVARHPSPFTLAAYDLYRAEAERRQRTEDNAGGGGDGNSHDPIGGTMDGRHRSMGTTLPNGQSQSIERRTEPHDSAQIKGGGPSQLRVVAPGVGDIVRHPSINTLVWEACLILAVDPCVQVAAPASALVDEIHMSFLLGSSGDHGHQQVQLPATTTNAEGMAGTNQFYQHLVGSPFGTEVVFVQQQGRPTQLYQGNLSLHAVSATSLALPLPISTTTATTSSPPSETVIHLPSALPLTSDLIKRAADAFVVHQRRRREMLLRKHEPPVYAKLRKARLVDGEAIRRWTMTAGTSGTRRFEHPLVVLPISETGAPITNVLFHPLDENKLIATDATGIVSTWRYHRDKNDGRTRRGGTGINAIGIGLGGVQNGQAQTMPLSMFRGAHVRTRITGIACVDWDPIKLLVGTSDGIVRLYCDFAADTADIEAGAGIDEDISSSSGEGTDDGRDESGVSLGEREDKEQVMDLRGLRSRTQMIAAWSTLATETTQDLLTQCTLLEWNQHQRRLYTVTGGTQLAVLDAAREQIVERLALPIHGQASALTSDRRESPIVTLGFADGTIRRYDLRQPTLRRMIASWRTQGPGIDPGSDVTVGSSHSPSLLSSGVGAANLPSTSLSVVSSPSLVVALRQSWAAGQELLLSASQGGELVEWDLRADPMRALVRRTPMNGGRITVMDQHQECPLMSTGGDTGIRVLESPGGAILGNIRHYEGFLGKRLAPIESLAFHPRQLLLAAGCSDGVVSIYRAEQ